MLLAIRLILLSTLTLASTTLFVVALVLGSCHRIVNMIGIDLGGSTLGFRNLYDGRMEIRYCPHSSYASELGRITCGFSTCDTHPRVVSQPPLIDVAGWRIGGVYRRYKGIPSLWFATIPTWDAVGVFGIVSVLCIWRSIRAFARYGSRRARGAFPVPTAATTSAPPSIAIPSAAPPGQDDQPVPP